MASRSASVSVLAGILVFTVAVSPPARAGVLYASDSAGGIFVLDELTGEATPLCVAPVAMSWEIEYDDLSGTAVRGFQAGTGSFSASRIEIDTCATPQPSQSIGSVRALEYVGSDLYGAAGPFLDSTLFILDPGTGNATEIGVAAGVAIGGLAYDPSTMTMYGISGKEGSFGGTNFPSSLYTIDLATGAATLVGATGIPAYGLEFGTAGRLFTTDGVSLYEVNRTTGGATLVGATGARFLNSLTFRSAGPVGPVVPDHFMFYTTRRNAAAPKPVRFGPLDLSSAAGDYTASVARATALGIPADRDGGGVRDLATHLEQYKLRKLDPRAIAVAPARIVNACDDVSLELRGPTTLLVPTSKSVGGPAPRLAANHALDHYLCSEVETRARLPRGVQVDVADQFQTRRYNLRRLTRLCSPVDKSGSPIFQSGASRGAPKPISPAMIRHPLVHLACYRAGLAKRLITQNGCRPAVPGDRGARIVPAQARHTQQIAVQLDNQFGSEIVDTVGETELCIPSAKDPRCGDGLVEAIVGEQCDDLNTASGDGCSSTCQTE
jgi:cysteine-rich repeat protein